MTTDGRLVAPDFELVHKVEGMDRKTAQRQVIGPYLSQCLRPIFNTEFGQEEIDEINAIETIGDVSELSGALKSIANQRLHGLLETEPAITSKVGTLIASKKGIVTWDSPETLLSEGVETGVATPLLLGAQILVTEAALRLDPSFSRNQIRSPLNLPVDYKNLASILRGSAVEKLLAILCKGPNGYLEQRSSNPVYSSPDFFEFRMLKWERNMVFAEAFKVVSGIVVGPSDDLVLSAHERRKKLNDLDENMLDVGNGLKRTSSGCPVRYTTYKDGMKVKPLVFQAKDFVAEAVRLAGIKAA